MLYVGDIRRQFRLGNACAEYLQKGLGVSVSGKPGGQLAKLPEIRVVFWKQRIDQIPANQPVKILQPLLKFNEFGSERAAIWQRNAPVSNVGNNVTQVLVGLVAQLANPCPCRLSEVLVAETAPAAERRRVRRVGRQRQQGKRLLLLAAVCVLGIAFESLFLKEAVGGDIDHVQSVANRIAEFPAWSENENPTGLNTPFSDALLNEPGQSIRLGLDARPLDDTDFSLALSHVRQQNSIRSLVVVSNQLVGQSDNRGRTPPTHV